MALKDYTIPRTSVDLSKSNKIEVRGLNLDDVSYLVQLHEGEIDRIVNVFRDRIVGRKAASGQMDPDKIVEAVEQDGANMAGMVIQNAPMLVANLIAVASDEPDAWANASQLPVPVQVEALIAVLRLTFNDVDGFKKFLGNVSAVLQNVAPQTKTATPKATKKRSTGTTA